MIILDTTSLSSIKGSIECFIDSSTIFDDEEYKLCISTKKVSCLMIFYHPFNDHVPLSMNAVTRYSQFCSRLTDEDEYLLLK